MIRCREIGLADFNAIADLLANGFPMRSRDYWVDGLRRMSARDVPEGFPRFGYLLDHDGTSVGALLLIHTARNDDGCTSIRCNLSSWYVEPAFRSYAPMLTNVAQRHKDVTHINISAAQWTWRAIEAQGFRRYCGGMFFSFSSGVASGQGYACRSRRARRAGIAGLSEADAALLARHAAYGWLSLVCRAADGRAFPFVLQPMRIRRGDAVPRLMQGAAVADDAFVGHANPTSESDQGQDRSGGDDHALHSTGDCTRDLIDRAGFGSEGRD
ncbi:acyl-CoA acyltransferase [Bradyrhizobium sp. SSUT18]|uniref:acyl-CoA acyltransferase n=1 Tax=Bradyrhizobium sp. SSUT18 TaxID=3040602 RepID=UPI00244A8F0D|nr:acyl-CoA acyltransferase [Bradyrhizobium sp. SSUT18]MDH2403135.1 acyl-CoA acyltransferase [Bradyrhizobium sp. SSUT18]